MATVTLIAKNKVLEYITAHPESQVAFLTFLKGFPYAAPQLSGAPIMGTAHVSQNYMVLYQMNSFANTACIIWLGSNKEHAVYIEETRKKYADTEKFKTKTIVVKKSNGLVSPKYPELSHTYPFVKISAENIENGVTVHGPTYEVLKTQAEYETSLTRAVSILAAKPESPEFVELKVLVAQIKNYEAAHFNFPELNLLDAIKLKMEHFGLPPDVFIPLLKNKETADLFFSGKKLLAKGYLQKICTRVGIKFPIAGDLYEIYKKSISDNM